jgi:hypothetical protein
MPAGVFPVPWDQFEHGRLMDKGQRPLDENRVEALYRSFCASPYIDLTTAGVCIIDEYEGINGRTLLSDFDSSPEDKRVFNELMQRVAKLPFGAQHGVKAQCLAYERHNGIVMGVLNARGGIGAKCYDFSSLNGPVQNKYITYLVSEHGDVQKESKDRTFMETMFTCRVYLKNILKVHSVKDLYTYLETLHPDDAEAEKQTLLEKVNPSSIQKTINSWRNATRSLRFALQIDMLWALWWETEKKYQRFETKGQAKQKQNILNNCKSGTGKKRGRKKKAPAKKKGSGKAKRVIKNKARRFDTKLLAVNTTVA